MSEYIGGNVAMVEVITLLENEIEQLQKERDELERLRSELEKEQVGHIEILSDMYDKKFQKLQKENERLRVALKSAKEAYDITCADVIKAWIEDGSIGHTEVFKSGVLWMVSRIEKALSETEKKG